MVPIRRKKERDEAEKISEDDAEVSGSNEVKGGQDKKNGSE